MSPLPDGWSGVLALMAACVLPTEIWRWIGVMVGSRIDPDAEVLHWVRAVAGAIIAAFIAKALFFPSGGMASLPLWVRAGSMLLGTVMYFVAGRHVVVGVLAGEAALVVAAALLFP